MKDLLDNVDLNTYGLRRTALNQTVALDDAETVVAPNKTAMVGAGKMEEEMNLLDEVLSSKTGKRQGLFT